MPLREGPGHGAADNGCAPSAAAMAGLNPCTSGSGAVAHHDTIPCNTPTLGPARGRFSVPRSIGNDSENALQTENIPLRVLAPRQDAIVRRLALSDCTLRPSYRAAIQAADTCTLSIPQVITTLSLN